MKNISNKDSAIKNDGDKARFSLIPQSALYEVARSFTHGAKKYGKFNYSKGMEYTRLTDAAFRHLNKALRGDDIDADSKEDKLYHLANAAASILMLLDSQIEGVVIDDRLKVNKVKSK